MTASNTIPNKAEIEQIADESLSCIVSYGTPAGQPLDERLRKTIRHYLIKGMTDVRNATIYAKQEMLRSVLAELSDAAAL
jgi:hypothetical protein